MAAGNMVRHSLIAVEEKTGFSCELVGWFSVF